MVMSRVPLDPSELLLKKKEAESCKPRFLTAAERLEQKQALALQRRAQAVEERCKLPAKRSASFDTDFGVQSFAANRSVPEKRKRRINDVKKFVFDWNAQDDTTDTANLSYDHNTKSGAPSRMSHSIRADRSNFRQVAANGLEHAPRSKSTSNPYRDDDLHWSEKSREQMRERDWRIFKEDYKIQVKGGSCPNPLRSWEEANFPQDILTVIKTAGYTEPTPIQKATIPIALESRDVIGIAETGSGKTASFVLPMLVHISKQSALTFHNRNDGPYAVVLAPTRELAQQIEIETRKFAEVLHINVVSLVGGHSIEEQSFRLSQGAQIVIATPGRLVDCLERHVLVLSQCNYIVMDEADRMVDLGFEDAVNQILEALPAHATLPDHEMEALDDQVPIQPKNDSIRQTIMFSATMPTAVEKLARKYLRRPATVIIGNAGQVVETVEQRLEIINGEEKRKKRMGEILGSGEFDRPVIVFVNTKRSCDTLSKYLSSIGWTASTLHGGKTQDQREAALRNLRSGESDILVATDLAGRGIDVPNVSLVLNFDMSRAIESYVHRIGRTGRAGQKGVAITFLGDEEEEMNKAIRALMGKQQRRPAMIAAPF